MAKVTAICGKICCGKTTYARRLCGRGAALLSIDEIMLALFGRDAGEKHDVYSARAERYLLAKAAELVFAGIDVVLDWGLWTAAKRREIRAYFGRLDIPFELYYIDIDEKTWRERIAARNHDVMLGRADAYLVDEGLALKFASIFEPPEKGETDGVISAADA